MRIVPLQDLAEPARAELVRLLRDGFTHQPAAFSGPGEVEDEVARMFGDEDRLGFAAVEGERVLGWIGAIRTYSHAWELHPIVVDPACRLRGVGSALVAALEGHARAEGVLTLALGTDDDFGGTSLYGRDLFPGALAKLSDIAPAGGHPVFFYRRLGYEVTGVVPDANGPGKPDILMAKRL